MKYEKPSLVALDTALAAIQSHTAKTSIPIPDQSSNFQSNSAYEADE